MKGRCKRTARAIQETVETANRQLNRRTRERQKKKEFAASKLGLVHEPRPIRSLKTMPIDGLRGATKRGKRTVKQKRTQNRCLARRQTLGRKRGNHLFQCREESGENSAGWKMMLRAKKMATCRFDWGGGKKPRLHRPARRTHGATVRIPHGAQKGEWGMNRRLSRKNSHPRVGIGGRQHQ